MGQKFTREDVAAAQTLVAMSRSQEKIDFTKIIIPTQNDVVQEAPVLSPAPANNAGDDEEGRPPLVNLGDIVGRVSPSLEKKLTTSDVKEDQGRLIIPKKFVKKHLLQILNANENLKRGIDVVTYDEGGGEYKMQFKLWASKLYVLTRGWKSFCERHDLKATQDYITIWMFRHLFTRKICFLIVKRRDEEEQ